MIEEKSYSHSASSFIGFEYLLAFCFGLFCFHLPNFPASQLLPSAPCSMPFCLQPLTAEGSLLSLLININKQMEVVHADL